MWVYVSISSYLSVCLCMYIAISLYGGLMRNVPIDSMKTWSIVDFAVWDFYESFSRCSLVGEVCHCGWALKVLALPHF